MDTWHYQLGQPGMTIQQRGTVQANDWIGAMDRVSKHIKGLGFEPNEIYIWSDDA
jgi:hypothetical protein